MNPEGDVMSAIENLRPEPFVSADEAAEFLSIDRRFLLALARRGIAGAFPPWHRRMPQDMGVPAFGTRGCHRCKKH